MNKIEKKIKKYIKIKNFALVFLFTFFFFNYIIKIIQNILYIYIILFKIEFNFIRI